jgi:predicted RNase H-like HicB family nuclease
MNSEIIFIVEEAAEGGYGAKALGESIFTAGETIEELKSNVKEAVHAHFDEGKKPSFIRLHFVKEELIKV